MRSALVHSLRPAATLPRMDGDGASDLVVAAVADTGAVYVYAARTGGPSLTPTMQRTAPVAGQDFGYGIAANR